MVLAGGFGFSHPRWALPGFREVKVHEHIWIGKSCNQSSRGEK